MFASTLMRLCIGKMARILQLASVIRCCDRPAIFADVIRGRNRLPNANTLLVVPGDHVGTPLLHCGVTYTDDILRRVERAPRDQLRVRHLGARLEARSRWDPDTAP